MGLGGDDDGAIARAIERLEEWQRLGLLREVRIVLARGVLMRCAWIVRMGDGGINADVSHSAVHIWDAVDGCIAKWENRELRC